MDQVIGILQNGGVGVMATDTIYGIIGSALDKRAVAKIYKLKQRQLDKPLIILIADMGELERFGIKADKQMLNRLSNYWPGPVSLILPCNSSELKYLHRGTYSLALRVPAKKSLRKFLSLSGPLVAPSANPENLPPAKNIKQAKQYFGDRVDFYKSGKVINKPSRLIRLSSEGSEIIRR